MISLLGFLDGPWEQVRGDLRTDLEHIAAAFNQQTSRTFDTQNVLLVRALPFASMFTSTGAPGPPGIDGNSDNSDGGSDGWGCPSDPNVATAYVPYTGALANVNLGIHDFKVDTTSLFVNATTHRVGVGTIAPSTMFHVIGISTFDGNLSTTASGDISAGHDIIVANARFLYWGTRSCLYTLADGQFNLTNNATSAGVGLDFATDAVLKVRGRALTAGTGSLDVGAKLTAYNNVTTAGWGVPSIYGSGRSAAAIAAVASVATYTVGAADGSFLIDANVLVTTATNHAFTVTVAYTDEGNTARTLTLSFTLVAGGALVTSVANANGAVPYMGLTQRIRCKASTAITVATVGVFTTVTYNVEASITQIA